MECILKSPGACWRENTSGAETRVEIAFQGMWPLISRHMQPNGTSKRPGGPAAKGRLRRWCVRLICLSIGRRLPGIDVSEMSTRLVPKDLSVMRFPHDFDHRNTTQNHLDNGSCSGHTAEFDEIHYLDTSNTPGSLTNCDLYTTGTMNSLI